MEERPGARDRFTLVVNDGAGDELIGRRLSQ